MKSKIVAHRGHSAVAPENTMAAFDAALVEKFDGIELDVHQTLDNRIVVIHDETIDRTSNGIGAVKKLTLDELRAFDFGAKFTNGEFEKQTIMTLEELLDKYGEVFEYINIEMKTDVIEYPGIEENTIAILNNHPVKAEVIISSFNFETIKRMHKIQPTLIFGYLFTYMEEFEKDFKLVPEICTYMHPWFKTLANKENRVKFDKLNMPYLIWSFDDPSDDEWTNGSDALAEEIDSYPLTEILISNKAYK